MRSIVHCILLAALASARPEGGHSKSIVQHSGIHDIHHSTGHRLVEHRPLGHDPHEAGFQGISQGFGLQDFGHQDFGHQDFGHQSVIHTSVGHEGGIGIDHHGGGGYEAPSLHQDQHQGPNQHSFEYVVKDPHYGGHFGHTEHRDGYVTKGSYFVDLPDGRRQTVHYTADQYGYHPVVTYEGEAHFDHIGNDYQPQYH